MTPDVLAHLIGDGPTGRPPSVPARWLIVGIDAGADEMRRALGPPQEATLHLTEAGDVHAALVALSRHAFDGCLVAASMLADRPRAAVRSLRRALGESRLLVLGLPRSKPVRRALRALEVTVVDPAPPTAPLPPPATAALPRADTEPVPTPREQPAARPVKKRRRKGSRFTDGCLGRMTDPAALTAYIVTELARASKAERASLMVREHGRRTLRLASAVGWNEALVGKVRCSVGSGIAGRVASLGRAVTGHGMNGGARDYPGEAYVVLPLGKADQVEGVLNLTGLPGDALPDPAALRTWSRMCRRAGSLLHNARRLRRAEDLSARDELTGLPNRRAFERALGRELERATRAGTGLVVGLLDIDHFKTLNDRFGHQAGDRALVAVAARLQSAFRDSDLVCRWGGEEFAVLLPGNSAGHAETALAGLERARRAVAQRSTALGPGLPHTRVTISGGMAALAPGRSEAADLLKAADEALYKAKNGGRDRICGA